jgi:hypothetical protein
MEDGRPAPQGMAGTPRAGRPSSILPVLSLLVTRPRVGIEHRSAFEDNHLTDSRSFGGELCVGGVHSEFG